jgi:hypothetical protein
MSGNNQWSTPQEKRIDELEELEEAAKMIREEVFRYALEIQMVINAVENRCMAADGPVTPTCLEITDHEIRKIYTNALKIKACSSLEGK